MNALNRTKDPFQGRLYVITGGARGIGRAITESLLSKGARVAILDADGATATATQTELNARFGGVTAHTVDVADHQSVHDLLQAINADDGPIYGVINNAGIMPTTPFTEEPDTVTRAIVEIDFVAVEMVSKIAARLMLPQGEGKIVNISSLTAMMELPGLATYVGAKAAVAGFSQTLREELRPHGIDVSVVLPSLIHTELSAGVELPWVLDKLFFADPEDVAATVLRAIRFRARRLSAPEHVHPLLRLLELLPGPVRRLFYRVSGLGRAFVHTEPVARERYHRRIEETVMGGKL